MMLQILNYVYIWKVHIPHTVVYCGKLKETFHWNLRHYLQTILQTFEPYFDEHSLQLASVFIQPFFHMIPIYYQLSFTLVFIIFDQIHRIEYYPLTIQCSCTVFFCNPLDMIILHCLWLRQEVYANLDE